MTIYDTTVILSPQLEEKGIDGRIKEIAGRIEENGGKIIRENRMGMRRLAYEIQKISQGYYVVFVYEGNGDLVKELERKFRLDESCLRFLTCLYQEVAPPKERFTRERSVTVTTAKPAEATTPKSAETTPTAASEVAPKTTEATAAPVTDEAPAKPAEATTEKSAETTPTAAPKVAPEATAAPTPTPTPAPTPESPATPAPPAEKDDSATEMEEL